MGKTRYFVVWARYHDTPEGLIDGLQVHGPTLKNIFVYEAMEPGSLTGSAEICEEEPS